MQTLQERLAEAEMERNRCVVPYKRIPLFLISLSVYIFFFSCCVILFLRLEDERKEVREMRQDMEALQAAVVAQTASLTIKQSPSVRTVLDANLRDAT